MATGIWRAGVDIGGTFTDVLLVDEKSGRFRVGKVLDGLVSLEQARDAYGVAFTADGALDIAETARLRASAQTS